MKEYLNKREIIDLITPVIENTAMRRGLIPLEISLEKENNRYFLRIFIYCMEHSVSHQKEYIIFKGHDVIIKLKNAIDEINEKTLSAKLIDYNESFGVKVLYLDREIIIPKDKIQYTKLNDKIEINKNKGEDND